MKKNQVTKAKHVLYTTPELYALFVQGTKTLAIRLDHPIFDQFKTRDSMRITYTTRHTGIMMNIVAIRRYASLEALVEKEDISKVRPDFAHLDTPSVMQRMPEILRYKNKDNDKVIVFELRKV